MLKSLQRILTRGYRGFRAHFNGANLDCGVFEEGDVIIDAKGAKHIIFNHLMKKAWKRSVHSHFHRGSFKRNGQGYRKPRQN
ncbi:hypothetical protein OCC_13086 [Thermococcus litoralis DSM 5473]|uniref:Uncharacterized protein n=1 Tax=Thermococcus litoralis (strain ATCC 51850 / DSM 5473 / JCM 8560 / NS-C) TaxID=523849 RepID=H3ZRK4_THELN|nr:hypothetical protein [Thermococcus litoralis]EHR77410.1 hypothetical protein OCC_13086 [Thermococcus litoralis DSM 5473]